MTWKIYELKKKYIMDLTGTHMNMTKKIEYCEYDGGGGGREQYITIITISITSFTFQKS